jgi:CheY-like chemotaxis protein
MVELSDTASPPTLPRREGAANALKESVSNKDNLSVESAHSTPAPSLRGRAEGEAEFASILLAEDNDDVAMLICNMLRDNGYSVTRAVDGQEALEMLREELPDMLITDIAMPRMDGLELMRSVRADDTMCCLPIVVVSARVEDHERLDGISAGAEVYLAKPFINEELLLVVEKLLEQRRRLRKMFTNSRSDDETSRQIPEADVNFFNDINKLIDDNLISGEVSTSFLADKLSTSVSTLNRRLKNMSGLTANIYIRNRRLLVAKRLLEKTDLTVSEIEVQCGFNTSGHFSRVFKAETGLSPIDYRQNQKGKK